MYYITFPRNYFTYDNVSYKNKGNLPAERSFNMRVPYKHK